jgi:hypothetical protein
MEFICVNYHKYLLIQIKKMVILTSKEMKKKYVGVDVLTAMKKFHLLGYNAL